MSFRVVSSLVAYSSAKVEPLAVTVTPNFATRAESEPVPFVTYFANVPPTKQDVTSTSANKMPASFSV